MLFRQLCLAASAAAFLIVPEASLRDEDTVNALPVDTSIDNFMLPPTALSQKLDLPCRKCRGRDTHLEMEFAVEDGSRLTLNGFELYPNADPWHGDLIASVVRGNGKERKQRLGYSLAVKPEGIDEKQQMEIISVELRVIEVGNRFVEGIPTVSVKLVRAVTGDILIGSMNMSDSPATCDSMWCRAKGIFGDAFHGFPGCRKFRHGHGPESKHHRPGSHRYHGRPGHHSRPVEDERPGHEWRLLKGLASHIFLPVLMGITAGFSVALFAMCLCRVAMRLTRLFQGEHQTAFLRCPRHQKVLVVESNQDEEKAALMNDQDLPPYEDESARN